MYFTKKLDKEILKDFFLIKIKMMHKKMKDINCFQGIYLSKDIIGENNDLAD